MPTSQQINDINSAYALTISTGDASHYYDALSAAGIYYGSMAHGVVNADSLIGIVANNYAKNKIDGDFASGLFDQRRDALMLELATRDYALRSTQTDWNLTGRQISDYHDAAYQTVFPELSGAAEGWTPYYEVRALNDYDFWLVTSSADLSQYLSYFRMNIPLTVGDATAKNYALQWFQDMDPFVFNLSQMKFIIGDDVLAKSLLQWAATHTGFLDSKQSYLFEQKPYAPANDTDASGFLGRFIHGLLIEEAVSGTSNILHASTDYKEISFDRSDLPTTPHGTEFDHVINQTIGTANELTLAGYNSEWMQSDSYKLSNPYYWGLDPHNIVNINGATFIAGNAATSANKDGNLVVLQGDVTSFTLNSTSQFILVGNEKDNEITLVNPDQGFVFSGAGNDHIIVSGVADNSWGIILPVMIDTGSGNDTIEFQDSSHFFVGYVMTPDGGHDVAVGNLEKYWPSDPASDYSAPLNNFLLSGLSLTDLDLEKTLVAQRTTTIHASEQWYEIDYVTNWWDVKYTLSGNDGATSIEIGTYSFSSNKAYYISTDVLYGDYTVDFGMSSEWTGSAHVINGYFGRSQVLIHSRWLIWTKMTTRTAWQ